MFEISSSEKGWVMTMKGPSNFCNRLAVWALAISTTVGVSHAGIQKPLYLGNQAPVKDVLGRPLPGSWGADSSVCSLVEIRRAGTNSSTVVVKPNETTGAANETLNPLWLSSRMGQNVLGENPGMFCETLPDRLPTISGGTVWYFARVYDASTVAGANYYADSELFSAPATIDVNVQSAVNVVFGPMAAIRSNGELDSDRDGIPDVLESELGTDSWLLDSDGDGFDDGFEVVHNMDPMQTYTFDVMMAHKSTLPSLPSDSPPAHQVKWPSVPGVSYRVEQKDTMMNEESFGEYWRGTATGSNMAVDVDVTVTQGFFRVWAVPPRFILRK